MLTWIVPMFMSMFADMDIEMPKITLAVMAASDWMKGHWYIVVLVIALIAVGIGVFKRSATGQRVFGFLALKIPLISNFTVKSAAAQFSRTMSTLMYSGISMVDALDITGNNLTNVYYKYNLELKVDILDIKKNSKIIEQIGSDSLAGNIDKKEKFYVFKIFEK